MKELEQFLRTHPWLEVTAIWEKAGVDADGKGFTVRISECDGSSVCYVGYQEATSLGEAMTAAIAQAVSS